jgi:hypothetical protein
MDAFKNLQRANTELAGGTQPVVKGDAVERAIVLRQKQRKARSGTAHLLHLLAKDIDVHVGSYKLDVPDLGADLAAAHRLGPQHIEGE